MRNKRHYFKEGARAFLCGRHIAAYGRSKAWQHIAATEGDKAIRVYLFGSVFPGNDKIRDFHDSILKADNRLELVDDYLKAFLESLKS